MRNSCSAHYGMLYIPSILIFDYKASWTEFTHKDGVLCAELANSKIWGVARFVLLTDIVHFFRAILKRHINFFNSPSKGASKLQKNKKKKQTNNEQNFEKYFFKNNLQTGYSITTTNTHYLNERYSYLH